MRYLGGIAAPGNGACGIPAGNCSETSLSATVPMASSLKGNSGKDFSERDMMTEAEKSAAPEIRHWHSKTQSRVNKFAQNLLVLKMAVEAEKEGLDPCSEQVRLFVLHRPRGKVRYVAQCSFVLQYYIHKCIGCGYAAVHGLDFEFSRTREGHLGSRPGKRARSHTKIPLIQRMSRGC
jgi:hypothetical protein